MKKKAKVKPVKTQVNRQKLSLGIALIILGLLFIFGRQRVFIPENNTFEGEPVKISGFNASKVNEDDLPQRIILSSLGIDLAVGDAKLKNGYWEVFGDKAGWGEGSGVPGKPGNQVIFAHAKEGLFLPLKSAKVGMRVYVLTKKEWFSYEIKEIKEVTPSQTEVIAPTEDEVLTLYTCSGFADSKRFIVTAKRL